MVLEPWQTKILRLRQSVNTPFENSSPDLPRLLTLSRNAPNYVNLTLFRASLAGPRTTRSALEKAIECTVVTPAGMGDSCQCARASKPLQNVPLARRQRVRGCSPNLPALCVSSCEFFRQHFLLASVATPLRSGGSS